MTVSPELVTNIAIQLATAKQMADALFLEQAGAPLTSAEFNENFGQVMDGIRAGAECTLRSRGVDPTDELLDFILTAFLERWSELCGTAGPEGHA